MYPFFRKIMKKQLENLVMFFFFYRFASVKQTLVVGAASDNVLPRDVKGAVPVRKMSPEVSISLQANKRFVPDGMGVFCDCHL